MSKDSQGPLWEVFVQKKAGQPFVHCGSLHAYDKEMALENA
ncbi:MAG: 1,2-phenylacetyl-CoA epoxidase subunit B, partial [Bacteroidia bacterium]